VVADAKGEDLDAVSAPARGAVAESTGNPGTDQRIVRERADGPGDVRAVSVEVVRVVVDHAAIVVETGDSGATGRRDEVVSDRVVYEAVHVVVGLVVGDFARIDPDVAAGGWVVRPPEPGAAAAQIDVEVAHTAVEDRDDDIGAARLDVPRQVGIDPEVVPEMPLIEGKLRIRRVLVVGVVRRCAQRMDPDLLDALDVGVGGERYDRGLEVGTRWQLHFVVTRQVRVAGTGRLRARRRKLPLETLHAVQAQQRLDGG
jgi:hypothetical protein